MEKKKALIRNWFADILLANGDELNLNLPKLLVLFIIYLFFCH